MLKIIYLCVCKNINMGQLIIEIVLKGVEDFFKRCNYKLKYICKYSVVFGIFLWEFLLFDI